MADMIEAKDAKKKLGCDDATLNNYVNSGTIRAQRAGGKLMLNAEDVEKLAGEQGDEEGTIVLTGDSDDLSIDLGKVVDDSSETLVHGKGNSNTESITFGDELEVVSFDDNQNTSELVFDETKQTGQSGNLSFTDSNTAVMTAVDETAVGATTAPIDFQTQDRDVVSGRKSESASSRRSVRSQRGTVEDVEVHWIWPTLLIASFVVGIFFIAPYYAIGMYPAGDDRMANKDRSLGAVDNAWTSMAGGIAGFSVEPNADRYKSISPGSEFVDISSADPQAAWRHKQFRGEHKERDERVNSFVITELTEDAATKKVTGAKGMHGTNYQVNEKTTPVANSPDAPIVELQVQTYPNK